MENKDKKIITLLVFFTIVFTVIGSTLAYFNWQTSEAQKTNVTFTAKGDFSCSVDGGGNITSGDVMLAPSTCMNSEYAIKRTVTVTPKIDNSGKTIYMDLWLDVNSLGEGLSDSVNFRYALTTSDSSCDSDIVASGTFNGETTGGKVFLLNSKEYISTSNNYTTTNTYYLYIWLDAEETSSSTMDQEFDLSLGGSCTDSSKASAPVIDTTGMIPVAISNNGVVSTVSEDNNAWYNYNQKEWANAVLVSEGSRSNYLNTNNVIVDQNDILAYYVWIPRYKYQIWTTTNSSNGNEQSINIIFQDSETEVITGSAVGEFITHPAFNFGGEKLAGIWVGKFETSQGTSSNVGTSNPTILPNIKSWVSQMLSVQFQTSLKFSGGILTDGVVSFAGSSTYGLANTTDSHQIKNSEWGAVAYLSHSEYGINEEIRVNNYSGTQTGCGSLTENAGTATTCEIPYGSGIVEYPQSTTGNISGVFDMSGGLWEYTMGVLADDNGNPRSGNSTTSNSGFNGMVYDNNTNTDYQEGIDFPPSKYYDLYTTVSNLTACNGGVCYGHALSETYNWYGDMANFLRITGPWFHRGGFYNNTANAGVFYSHYHSGGANYISVTRSVLVVR